ncbi:MAG TPA: TlpA disulfide reductase family protein [Terracidiphilus sp.]|nr:TlpA disulfide reductase family protein [Terracidiphilus sp.]
MKRSVVLAVMLLMGLPVSAAYARRAPNLELKDLTGHTHHLADLRGSVVVFNFWATWCGPCREELPMLTRLSKEYAARHVLFIAASADDLKNRAKVEQFVSSHAVGMDVWVGADLDMLEQARLGNELPATLILDSGGNVVRRIKGEAHERDIRDAVDWVLQGEQGSPPIEVITHY